MKMSYYKAHEIRMWLKDIIIPSVTGAAVATVYIYNHPEIREAGKKVVNKILKKDKA